MQLRSSVFDQNRDHLVLFAGIIKQLGLFERIGELLGENSRATKFGSVTAMIINGLGFTNQALYLVSNFFSNKPIDRPPGDHLKGEHFNEDSLSVSLNKFAMQIQPDIGWVFKLLEGISIVTMTTEKILHSAVSNLIELAERIIRLFGHETEMVCGLENRPQQNKAKKNEKKQNYVTEMSLRLNKNAI